MTTRGDEGSATATPAMALLAEDDLLVAKATQRWLESRGFSVNAVASAADAIAALRRGASPDLIVLDYDLGDGTGEAVLYEIEHLKLASPVVLYTGAYPDLVDRVARFHGVAGVVKKPGRLSAADLWAAIVNARQAARGTADTNDRQNGTPHPGANANDYLESRVDLIVSTAGGASPLERLILRLRLENVPVKVLGDAAGVSDSTARRALRRVLHRLGAATFADVDRVIAAKRRAT